jgi:dipeptidyl aminopeptidase/acylaminoacyl peptidase
MRRSAIVRATVAAWACAGLWLAAEAQAQGTVADYQRAMALGDRYQAASPGMAEPATWIEGTSRLWYRRSVAGGHEFVRVDAESLERGPAFDHEKLAAALSKATGGSYTPLKLPFNTIEFANKGGSLQVRVEGDSFTCSLADYTCRLDSSRRQSWPPPPFACANTSDEDKPVLSPDKKLEALVRNFNLAIRKVGANEVRLLTTDGSEGNCYQLSSMKWSPDSTKLAAYRVRPGYRRLVHFVESSPEDQLQPKYSSRFYAKPGDVLDLEQPVIFDVASGRATPIDSALFPNPYDMSPIAWRKDSSAVTFEYNQRGHQRYRVIEARAENGAARAVISESAATFFNYSGKKYRYDVKDGVEIVWMSERDGWNHLYLYDSATGAVKNQITKGDWAVRGVSKVDDDARQIWFSASGMYPGEDPYFVYYYRINFDGSGLTRITGAPANHTVSFSPDMKYFVDTYSRVDMAPIAELRRTSDGGLVRELERGDLTELRKAGWQPPEVFTAKGRDGRTDIWGVIYRPTNFDPRRKYPVIENIYAGPQAAFVRKSFSAFNQMQAQAELGFVVVQIDGMGTSNRSKAFHDVAWQNLKDAGFPDRILWHKAVAAKYPWYDVSRVGIYGTSAGGQNSLGALLFHPEFYRAAVSAAGCHDNRMDKIWWNEQWMGWPIGPQYAESSNVDNAYRLQGKVLLVVGEMDTNVDPSSTMQVVNQLIKHDKDFDLLVVPGMGHGAGGAYGEHKRYDFFVRNLLGVNPPDWSAFKKPEPARTTEQ